MHTICVTNLSMHTLVGIVQIHVHACMKMISSGFNLFLDSSKRLQYNNRIFEAVHAGQAEAFCKRENRPLMVCHKAKTGTDVRDQKMGCLNGQTTEGGDRARGR